MLNEQLIELYRDIGRGILTHQTAPGWGNGVVGWLVDDLPAGFSQMEGLLASNLQYIRGFAVWNNSGAISQQGTGKHAPGTRRPRLSRAGRGTCC